MLGLAGIRLRLAFACDYAIPSPRPGRGRAGENRCRAAKIESEKSKYSNGTLVLLDLEILESK